MSARAGGGLGGDAREWVADYCGSCKAEASALNSRTFYDGRRDAAEMQHTDAIEVKD